MATSQMKMWKEIQSNLPKGEWVDLKHIYSIVEKNIKLEPDDFIPAATTTKDPRWHRNVRNILQHRKQTEEVVWSGDARYMIPISTDELIVTSSVPIKSGLSEKEFRKLQERRIEIGRMGEEYVVNEEKKYLKKEKRNDLAKKVKRISINDIGAGYDVISYDLNGNEKFIEVKATTGCGDKFEFTINEYRTAEKYGNDYWLYFVRDIGGSQKITKIQNPINEIENKIIFSPSVYIAHLIGEKLK